MTKPSGVCQDSPKIPSDTSRWLQNDGRCYGRNQPRVQGARSLGLGNPFIWTSRLFGVRSWDWYHVKAHTLYFHTIKTLFDFDKFSVFKFEENKPIWIRFRINFTVWSPFEMRMFAIFPRFIARYETYPICKTGATSVRVRSPQPVNMGSQLEIKRNNHNKKQFNLELICLPGVCAKNTKKKKVDREIIIFWSFLWFQKRAQSIQHARITIFSAQEQLRTPLEPRDKLKSRSIFHCSMICHYFQWFFIEIHNIVMKTH